MMNSLQNIHIVLQKVQNNFKNLKLDYSSKIEKIKQKNSIGSKNSVTGVYQLKNCNK